MKILLKVLFSLIFVGFFTNPVLALDRVNINTASLEQLKTLTGIADIKAQAIINARPFPSVDDLVRVSGIKTKTLQGIKDQGLAYVDGQIPSPTQAVNPTPEPTTPIVTNQPVAPTPPQTVTTPPVVQPTQAPQTYPAGVIINEIFPSPQGADETGEWIELYNKNNFDVILDNWKIQDTEGTIITYTFPVGTNIVTTGYLVLNRPETKITLNNLEDGLKLLNPNGETIDTASFKKALLGQSYSKMLSGVWAWSTKPTPGIKNLVVSSANSATNKTNSSSNSNSNFSASLVDSLPKPKSFKNVLLIGLVSAIILAVISFAIILKFKKPNPPEIG